MAVLSDPDRQLVWANFMKTVDAPGGITKADLRAALNAADAWVDSNSTSYNTALPLPARTVMTARQKAALLMYVVSKRYEVS